MAIVRSSLQPRRLSDAPLLTLDLRSLLLLLFPAVFPFLPAVMSAAARLARVPFVAQLQQQMAQPRSMEAVRGVRAHSLTATLR